MSCCFCSGCGGLGGQVQHCAIWSKELELGMRGKDESEGAGGTSQTSTVP